MGAPDNPSAFPQSSRADGPFGGMTLRDWFAAFAAPPGFSEVAAVAGGETDGTSVIFNEGGAKYALNDWWNDLPLADRAELVARVRYAFADAMLAERARPAQETEQP